jgi:two-component system NarL family sensor kinase
MLFFINNYLFAQNYFNQPPAKDLTEIKQMPASAEKIEQVLRYARNPRIVYNDGIRELIEEAIQTTNLIKRDDLKAALIATSAIIELNLGNQTDAIKYIKQAETFLPKLNDLQTAILYSDFTRIYNRIGDLTQTIIYHEKLEAFTKDKPQLIIQRILNLRNRSNIDFRYGNKEKVKLNYELALKLSKESNNPNLLRDTRFAYANILLNQNKDKEAFAILKDLIPDLENTITDRTGNFFEILSRNFEETGDYKNALIYAEKLFNLPNATVQQKGRAINKMILLSFSLKKFSDFDKYIVEHRKYGMDLYNIVSRKQYQLAESRYYDAKQNNNLAKKNYLKAFNIKLGKQIAPNFDVDILIGLANIYKREGKKDSANFYNKKAEAILKKYNLPTIYQLNYNQSLKNYAASETLTSDILIKNLKQEIALKDTIYQMRLAQITNELETKYKVTENRRALELIKKQQQIQQLEIKQQKQKNWLIIISAAIGILVFAGIAYLINQRKKQASKLHDATLNDLKNKHRIEIMHTFTDAEEKEKKRIAERLHDEVGAMLSIAKLNIDTLKANVFTANSDSENKLQVTKNLMSDISETVRNISHTLMPIALEKYGFKAAILDLLTAIKAANSLKVEHIIEGLEETGAWSQNFILSTYRIIQELLNNVIKHSEATNLFIQIIELDKTITIYIEDNGKGIAPENLDKDGAGMKLLKTNVDYLSGKIEINGKPNEGTFALIELPIPNMTKA